LIINVLPALLVASSTKAVALQLAHLLSGATPLQMSVQAAITHVWSAPVVRKVTVSLAMQEDSSSAAHASQLAPPPTLVGFQIISVLTAIHYVKSAIAN